MDKVSVIILNYNGVNHLRQFLPSVISNSKETGVKIIVADNASTDGSVIFMKEHYPDIRLIELPSNTGYTGGYNNCLQLIESEYYVLLNSDVEVTPGWITPVIDYLDANPDVAAAMPKILAFNEKNTFEYAGASGGFIDKFGYPFCRGRILYHVENDLGQYNSIRDIFWASGACFFVRASLFHKAGGFDNDFFAHMEEIDLCWRFSRMGYRNVIIPESTVYHVGGGTLPINTPFKMYLNYRNNLFLLHKNLPGRKLIPVILTRLLLDGASAMVYLSKFSFGFFRAVFRAHRHFYASLLKTHKKRGGIKELGRSAASKTIYNGSMVFQFMVLGKKTFDRYRLD